MERITEQLKQVRDGAARDLEVLFGHETLGMLVGIDRVCPDTTERLKGHLLGIIETSDRLLSNNAAAGESDNNVAQPPRFGEGDRVEISSSGQAGVVTFAPYVPARGQFEIYVKLDRDGTVASYLERDLEPESAK